MCVKRATVSHDWFLKSQKATRECQFVTSKIAEEKTYRMKLLAFITAQFAGLTFVIAVL